MIVEGPEPGDSNHHGVPPRAAVPEAITLAASVPAAAWTAPDTNAVAEIVDDDGASTGRNRWLIVGAVLVGLAAIAFYVRMESRVQEAALRASAAERGVSETREAAREQLAEIARNADSRVASAQQAAQSAQMVASIVSAPDAQRFELSGRGSAGAAAGQMLWSRYPGPVAHREWPSTGTGWIPLSRLARRLVVHRQPWADRCRSGGPCAAAADADVRVPARARRHARDNRAVHGIGAPERTNRGGQPPSVRPRAFLKVFREQSWRCQTRPT